MSEVSSVKVQHTVSEIGAGGGESCGFGKCSRECHCGGGGLASTVSC